MIWGIIIILLLAIVLLNFVARLLRNLIKAYKIEAPPVELVKINDLDEELKLKKNIKEED